MGTPGPEGSIGKLVKAESNKRIYEFTVDLMGADGMLYSSYAMHRPEHAMEQHLAEGVPAIACELDRGRHLRGDAQHPGRARARPARRCRVDKDVAWSSVPRN